MPYCSRCRPDDCYCKSDQVLEHVSVGQPIDFRKDFDNIRQAPAMRRAYTHSPTRALTDGPRPALTNNGPRSGGRHSPRPALTDNGPRPVLTNNGPRSGERHSPRPALISGLPSSYDAPQPRTLDKTLILAVDDTNRTVVIGTSQQVKSLLDPDKLPLFKDLNIDMKTGHIRATMNPDRVQCGVCDEWFFDKTALRYHDECYSFHCEEHSHCFASHDIYIHAQEKAHQPRFVRSCDSRYRNETGWGADEIKKHIRESDYPKRAGR